MATVTDYLIAAFLGFIEGLTEFIPVSSTGHLIVIGDWLNYQSDPNKVFEVFIQLGAILAVVLLYRKRIWDTIVGLPRDPVAQRFTLNLILGCLPAFIAGAIFHDAIKDLYRSEIVGTTLILGGIAILMLENRIRKPRYDTVDEITPKAALLVGCFQMLALIPGVSRSGATILGGLSLGLSRPAAAEFSFFLAMPVMSAAVLFDLIDNRDVLLDNSDRIFEMLVGFFAAFFTALVVVKQVIRLVSRFGFKPFGWYRIGFGIVILSIFALA